MASVKIKFRPSAQENQLGTIYYQIIHRRVVKQMLTSYRVFPSEWNTSRSIVVMSPSVERKPITKDIRDNIRQDLKRINRIIHKLDEDGNEYSCEDVIDTYNAYMSQYSVFNYTKQQIDRLKSDGKIRTAETYIATLNSFRNFRNDKDIMLDNLTSNVMESYEAWQRGKGNSYNTISFYTRILRAVYRRAIEEGVITDRSPFRHVYTGVEKTVKRAISISLVRDIRLLSLSATPKIEFARDMFILSFYLRGMSFIDMAFLKKTDLRNGYLTYRRHKTGQRLVIAWTPEMQALVDKYPANPTHYLLPILKKKDVNERCFYKKISESINKNLKKIGDMVGIKMPLTMYCARHSWASAAREKGIPISVISEGMGHDSELTTQIYLASLDTTAVDKANALILESV